MPYNTKDGVGWVNIEEGYRGWQAHGRQMGDSSCDSLFNVETCLYDMGDCCLPGRYTIKRLNFTFEFSTISKFKKNSFHGNCLPTYGKLIGGLFDDYQILIELFSRCFSI